MKKITDFNTSQCKCTLYETEWMFNGERVYCIVTWHNATGKVNTRFGNKLQMQGILATYPNMRYEKIL